MKGLILETKKPTKSWDEDAFAGNNTPPPPAGSDEPVNNDGVIDAVLTVAKNTKDMIVDESKTIAPDVASTFTDSKARLDSEHRIIDAIPNSYLYYGIVAIVGYVVVKKFL